MAARDVTEHFGTHDTALIAPVPEAEAAVGRWREQFDPAAAAGVPAHVTVLFPFVPWSDVDETVIDALTSLAKRAECFDAVLAAVERRPGVIWIRPEPEEGFRALTAAVWDRWPEHPPYGGRFDEVVPHLTVAEGDLESVPESLDADVARHLPIAFSVTGIDLVRFAAGRWSTMVRFPLG
jgi:2'-5' RNA ligase